MDFNEKLKAVQKPRQNKGGIFTVMLAEPANAMTIGAYLAKYAPEAETAEDMIAAFIEDDVFIQQVNIGNPKSGKPFHMGQLLLTRIFPIHNFQQFIERVIGEEGYLEAMQLMVLERVAVEELTEILPSEHDGGLKKAKKQ